MAQPVPMQVVEKPAPGYYRFMAKLRLSAILVVLLSVSPAMAGSSEPATPKPRPTVREKTFDVPLDFKSRSDFNIGDPASIPSGRLENLSIEPKTPFFGLGLKQPFGSTK